MVRSRFRDNTFSDFYQIIRGVREATGTLASGRVKSCRLKPGLLKPRLLKNEGACNELDVCDATRKR